MADLDPSVYPGGRHAVSVPGYSSGATHKISVSAWLINLPTIVHSLPAVHFIIQEIPGRCLNVTGSLGG